MEFTILEIAGLLSGEVIGNGEKPISKLSKIQEGTEGSISFLSNPKYESYIYSTEASAVIVSKDFNPKSKVNTTLIKVDDPYSSFSALLEEYHRLVSFQIEGIEDPSYIGKNTKTGNRIYRGAFSYIGDNVTIDDNVKIYPQAYIGNECKIGENTIIHPGVKIYEGTVIGKQCVIHAGTVIGSDGFGFAPQKDGNYKTIPQMGFVIIEDNVSIGANTTIDSATLQSDATIIHEGVKLDNLIQVAHNVEIGKDTVIAAQTGVSGSVKIGENCIIGGQVGIAGHLEIASRSSFAAKSGIPKTIKESGGVYMGAPIIDHKKYLKCYTIFRNLPELNLRLRHLEEKVLTLRSISKDDAY